MEIIIYVIAALSVIINLILSWYIMKLLSKVDDITLELTENINAFQNNLEQILQLEIVAGEPIVMQLLEDVRTLGQQTDNIKNELIMARQTEEEAE